MSALRKHEYTKHLNEIQLLSNASADHTHSKAISSKRDVTVSGILGPEQFDPMAIQEEEEESEDVEEEAFAIPNKLGQ